MVIVVLAASSAVAQGTQRDRTPVSSDTLQLTLVQARALAVRANPDLRAARLDVEVARGELRQAGLVIRSNPEVDIVTRGLGTEIAITQEFEVAGQRSARQRAALAGVERSSASVTDIARTTLGDVDRRFYRFIAAERRTELAQEVLDLNRRLAEVSQRKIEAGEISKLDYNLAAVEYGRSRARALAARREREEVAVELRQLLGLAARAPIVAVMDSSGGVAPADEDSLAVVALARRPDFVERTAAVRVANAQVSVARREALPKLIFRVSSERIEGSGNRELRPGFGLTLPAFNRNQGEIQARQAATLQAELARTSLTARVRAEVSRAIASYRAAAAETEVLRTTVLAPARENRVLLETAYREGKVGLPILLLIRNQVIDAELQYWEAWLAEHVALASLAEATGETVVGFNARRVP